MERILPDPAEVDCHGGIARAAICFVKRGAADALLQIRKVRPLARRMHGVARLFHRAAPGAERIARRSSKFWTAPASPVKISPLADWTTEDVARYTLEHGLPEHPLYAAGYTSIGCDPCTRAVARAKMNGPAAGGGRPMRLRSAACTSRPMAGPNARWTCCCAKF